MLPPRKLNSWLKMRWCIAVCCGFAAVGCPAADWSLESVGARGGVSASSSSSQFHQAEGFLNANLPWSWNLGANWRLQSRLDFSVGWLGSSTEDALVATLGPSLVLARKNLPLNLEGGVSPTLLSRSDFGAKDFGVLFQFTSHIGLNWDFARHFRLGGRFQHMSNAHLSNNNPGLNMYLFGLSYLF